MSYNGAGTFLINSAGQPVVAGTTISETVFNALTADLATGLSTAFTKDGQTTATANLPMGGFKLTNLGAGTASTDSARLGQVQSGAANLIAITGTNTLVGTLTPTLTAYAAGQQFSFVAAATNTTSMTLNIDGLGAKAITQSGATALIAGDITVGKMITVIYDGTQFQTSDALVPISTGNRLINGAMQVDQRNAGASQTITAGAALAYTVDHWYAYCTGANVTGARTAGTAPSQYNYVFTGAASNTAVGFGQRIEQLNSFDLANTIATLSVNLASSSITTVTWTAYYATTTADTFGTLAAPTVTSIATGTFTITSTLKNYSANISIPSAATTGLQILFTTGALTAANTWTIGAAQLESGGIATPFQRIPINEVFAQCQRYYEKSYSDSAKPGSAPGAGNCTFNTIASSGAAVMNFPFNVRKRTAPTMTIYDGAGTSGVISYYNGAWNNGGAITLTSGYQSSFFIQTNIVGSLQINFEYTASAEL